MADMSVHHGTTHASHGTRAITLDGVANGIAYGLALFGVYFTVGYVMWTSAAEKLFAGSIVMPAALAKTFAGTWIASLVGVNFLWGVLGVVELAIVLVMLASLVRGEFLPSRSKALLQVGLSLSLVLFSFLAFGEAITANFPGILSQYTYFGITILIMGLVRMMPPNRSTHWLTHETHPAEEEPEVK
jgi:hypothetical protein